jgi:phospholipid/cholesterol/gamma-HCH transport system substrate-binding protein
MRGALAARLRKKGGGLAEVSVARNLSRIQAMVLGVLVVGTLLLGGSALLVLNERSGGGAGGFRVHAGFADINGVEVGTRVRIQGMDAGEIDAILLPATPGGNVKLRMRIAGKYRHLIGADARVQIAGESLLAGKVVRILPGTADAQPVEEDGELRADLQPDVLEGIAQAATKLNRLLTEVDGALQGFRKNEGSVTEDLVNATKKLNIVLSKADAALDSIDRGEGTLGKLVKNESLYNELTETLVQVKTAIHEVRSGEGTLGKLVKTNDAYAEAMASLQDVRRMVNSVKQNSDAIKALPVVRSYVVDPNKELIRPDCKRLRKWFAEKDLFEPGKAVLTPAGKKVLDGAAVWLNQQKDEGAELLVASFAEPSQPADFAHTVTQKQSEVVTEYLRSHHKVHRTGWWWWSTRTVRCIGCGTSPSPIPETEKLPAARIELIVFVPQG